MLNADRRRFAVRPRTPSPPTDRLAGGRLAAGLGDALDARLIVAVLTAALYVELRTVKEGATTDDLAAIFA